MNINEVSYNLEEAREHLLNSIIYYDRLDYSNGLAEYMVAMDYLDKMRSVCADLALLESQNGSVVDYFLNF